jgi:MFS family permease
MQAKGRYNSVINTAWQMGSIFGPMITGIVLGMHQAFLLLFLFIFILIVLAPLFIRLEKYIEMHVT